MNILLRWIRYTQRIALVMTAALILSSASCPLPAEAYVVTVVKDTEVKPYQDAVQGFMDTCMCTVQEADLSEGDGIEQIMRKKPDAVIAVGTGAFRKVRSIPGLPVIYLMVMPSETTGLSDNMSGVSMDISPEAYLTAITEMFPHARKIGVFHDPRHGGPFVGEASEIARRKGIELVVRTVRSSREVPALLDGMRNALDVLLMLPDPTVVNPETVDSIMLFSFQNNVPIFSFSSKYVDRGAVAALQASPFDMGAQAGEIAKALSSGRKGPVRAYANKYRLLINRKVAAKMGIRFSPDVLKKAE